MLGKITEIVLFTCLQGLVNLGKALVIILVAVAVGGMALITSLLPELDWISPVISTIKHVGP